MNEETTIDIKRKNVFLSGPMTGIEDYNIAEFVRAHVTVKRMGAATVFNPALGWLEDHDSDSKTHYQWMQRTLSELLSLNDVWKPYYGVLVLLDGWTVSPGAMTECAVAEAIGIPVIEMRELMDA